MSTHLFQYKPYNYSYEYDYVFAGAGAATMSLLVRMILSGQFKESTFLVVDKDQKQNNDRTWCFWEKEAGLFEKLVHKSWDQLWFHGPGFSKKYPIKPYRYKMIRGIDFYNFCLDFLKQQSNVQLLFEPVERIEPMSNGARLLLKNKETYYAKKYLFNSIPFEKPVSGPGKHTLLQHFKGWLIETENDFFDPAVCTLMDFRINQAHGTSFVYTMPLTARSALVEYTLFTESLLNEQDYEEELKTYIRDYLRLNQYLVKEREFGIIPMTNQVFSEGEGAIVNIGTAGGQTKPSSGYTFQFIQRHSDAILYSMLQHGHPRPSLRSHEGRFFFYDSVLLDVLVHKELGGAEIFTRLFKRNSAKRVFRFLDNSSYLPEELLLIGSLPVGPFLRAARRQLFPSSAASYPTGATHPLEK
ncbi:lycopene cyclase family protein [Flavihumibacter sp. CACIAM 22H1]|uniref:lycopene cyclase family protein n=1 Tax=Flavihumibacter sp. CACIAM 22H1 TaxID=1812911 RepID=UPI000A97F921|nr:lycopene cyclase family protein [Flavihumibacter sp. CACIAM 22H1]